jgi:hypothetical protein
MKNIKRLMGILLLALVATLSMPPAFGADGAVETPGLACPGAVETPGLAAPIGGAVETPGLVVILINFALSMV